jgi:hypothetical protein
MKIVCTSNRDKSDKSPLVVMVAPPEEHPGPKIVLAFPIGETVDLKSVIKEKGIKYSADELGHVIMGDKRFKGLFKVVGAAASADTVSSTNDEPTPTPKKRGPHTKKLNYDNKALDTSDVSAG